MINNCVCDPKSFTKDTRKNHCPTCSKCMVQKSGLVVHRTINNTKGIMLNFCRDECLKIFDNGLLFPPYSPFIKP